MSPPPRKRSAWCLSPAHSMSQGLSISLPLCFSLSAFLLFPQGSTLSGCVLHSANTCSPLTSSSGRTFYTSPQTSFCFVVLVSFRPLVFTDSASHDLGSACLHPVSTTSEPPRVGLLVQDSDSLSLSVVQVQGRLENKASLKFTPCTSVLHLPSAGLAKIGCLTSKIPWAFFFSFKDYIILPLLTQ